MKELPLEFTARMKKILGEDGFSQYLHSFESPAVRAFRVNTEKISLEKFASINPFPGKQIPYVETGYYLEQEKAGNHPFHHAGMIYIQDPGAMATAECLDINPDWWILDLCAAPGGKSSQLRNKLGPNGILVSNEIVPSRCKILTGNIERLGFRNTATTCMSPDRLAKIFPETFDLVMVDAPCSGEGMFRKEEAAVTDWSQALVEMCADRQSHILDAGAALVRPGGRLVYSTCTFSPEENEQAIAAFLQRHPEFEPEDICAPWFTPAGTGQFRLWPHKLLGEGHFAAVLRKKGDAVAAGEVCGGQKLPKEWLAFSKDLELSLPDGKAILFGSTLYWAPEALPDLKGLKVLRPGLELGEIKKDRFQPAHALALWLQCCKTAVSYPADSPEIQKYLHGEALPSSLRGWCLVQMDGYSIGWGKGDGTWLKNHYPKGLRR